ncbi:hypothetical protein [Streptomyces triticiradicis]|uniref:Uncharacterized protein n=1 Tax=Streptomyces triticiradicis TaxID=2651189 RepID=A0A7J5D7X2_9ACTN|nr:hypothetical protein [Streptomyces triticiradicis]KAB1979466.1 hypothetical protein F8144_36250 [Streptomyces triticiradicis]
MRNQQLFETAVRDGIQVLKLIQQGVFAGPAFTTADASTEAAKTGGWTFKEIEAEAERRFAAQ